MAKEISIKSCEKSNDLVTRFGKLCLRYGVVRMSAACSGVCVFVSVVLTAASMLQMNISRIEYGISIAALIPLLISFPSFYLVWTLIDRLYQVEQKLLKLVNYDALTSLPNRRYLSSYLDGLTHRFQTGQACVTALLVDVDYFKKYNDLYGHQQGDLCLQQVAEVLKRGVSDYTGILARYGGEEFIVILEEVNPQQVARLAETLCQNVESVQIRHEGSAVSSWVTVSVGGCTMTAVGEGGCLNEVIARADRCLYLAKGNGRNTYETADLAR